MRNTILFLLLIFTFSSCDRTSEKDSYYLYLEEVLGESPKESQHYIIVSDYGCSACKEQVYQDIEERSSQHVYVIVQPRNKAILLERFQEAIFENRLYIDSARINLDKGIIIEKAAEILMQDGKWGLRELDDVL